MNKFPRQSKYGSYRPVITSRNGMVCSGHFLASQAGAKILNDGGNAVDAALAIGASLNVVEPASSGIGGDGYLMVYWAKTGEISVINGTGSAPNNVSPYYESNSIPMEGPLSISVPGLVYGWQLAYEKYCSLSLESIFEPAIDQAENGFPITELLANEILGNEYLRKVNTSKAVFTLDDLPLKTGNVLLQKNLAKTFIRLSRKGLLDFYNGEIGSQIISFIKSNKGCLTEEDFQNHTSIIQPPIRTRYKDFEVYEAPPNSSGHVLLQELNILENFDLSPYQWDSQETIHLMVEAKRLAFSDREKYLGDPNFIKVPIDRLLSKEYAKSQAAKIDLDSVLSNSELNNSLYSKKDSVGDTTCYCVVDKEGNAVCALQSLQTGFGSGLIAGETGVLLNNRMTYWHLDQGHPNYLESNKKVRHTMNPFMATTLQNNNRQSLVFLGGTPGADTQVQTNLQLLTNLIDFKMNVAEAVEAPRWRHIQNVMESTINSRDIRTNEIRMERRFSQNVIDDLMQKGHQVSVIGPWEAMGSAMLIKIDSHGSYFGAADPRRDGYAIGT